jgi:hypothetical protein
VTISFNGTPATTAPSKNEFFKVLLATPDNQWTVETVNVTATEGATRAPLLNPPMYLQGIPQ